MRLHQIQFCLHLSFNQLINQHSFIRLNAQMITAGIYAIAIYDYIRYQSFILRYYEVEKL